MTEETTTSRRRTTARYAVIAAPCAALRRVRAFAVVLFSLPLAAQTTKLTCKIQPYTPTDADREFAQGRFAVAETLYSSMAASPTATAGVVRAKLAQRQTDEALALILKESAAHPDDPLLLDVLGEVRYRRGEVDEAAIAYNRAMKLDPCSARVHYDFARYMNLSGLYASAQAQLEKAHTLAPDDPLIKRAWQNTQRVPLTPEQQVVGLKQREQDASLTDDQRFALEGTIKAIQAQEKGGCELAAPVANAKIPLYPMAPSPNQPAHGAGVDVSFNGKRRRLQVDTGASGLSITSEAAKSLGLTPEAEVKIGGIGDKGAQSTYLTHVDDLRIGDLDFHNCMVHVFQAKNIMQGEDGLLGPDIFRNYVVTLDLPAYQMRLSPLPKRPDEADKETSLGTAGGEDEDGLTIAQTRRDRYIAPEMSDWSRVFRFNHFLIFPTSIGKAPVKLFVMDTGAGTTLISPAAAREVTKVSSDSDRKISGLSGDVKNVSAADSLSITFAKVRQQNQGLTAIDTSSFSGRSGVEISGFLGYSLLRELVISIDYRDNLVHVTYSPHLEDVRH